MIHNFNKLNGALKEAGTELNFKYKFENPKFYKNSIINQFNENGLLNIKNNIEINCYGGLNVYKNLFVMVFFGELKKRNKHSIKIHFSKCPDFIDKFEKKNIELNLFLPNTSIFKEEAVNKNFQKYLPCEECLKIINWNNINKAEDWSRRIILEQFSIENLYDHVLPFQKELIAGIHSQDFLHNLPSDFTRTNEVIKAQKKWICEFCKTNTSGMKKILHIEVKDTLNKTLNSSNYISICSSCMKLKYNDIIIMLSV